MTALSPRLQPLFETTKTVCFGRFTMEVPATATVVFGTANVPSPIERLAGEGERISEWVAKRLGKIEEERYLADKRLLGIDSMYGKTFDGAVSDQKLVFGHALGTLYKIESFVKVGADLYVQETIASPKEVPAELALLNNIARSLRARADDEVPNESGMCIDGAFVSGQLDQNFEKIFLGVRLREFPDVHFSVNTAKANSPPSESDSVSMERRLQEAERGAQRGGNGSWYSRIKFLRRGERDLLNSKGYEVLARKPALDHTKENHEFLFLSSGQVNDSFKPNLEMQLNTGADNNRTGAVPISLTDAEAVAVWDKLTSSIRVRPTTGATKTSDSAPPEHPLGELAATGRDCPATGWWRCADEGDVKGGRHQFFRAGERMPHVVLQGDPSLWQKLKGDTPTHRIATVWKLVEHDAPITSTGAPPAVAAVPMPQQLPPLGKS